jgi:hypothetical protein
MNRKFRMMAFGLSAASLALMAALLGTPAPVQAQAPPTPAQCTLSRTTPEAWDTSSWGTRTFSCVTIEVQTRAYLHWPCVPGPSCIPWPVFEIRARRINHPRFVMARAQAIPGPTCVLQPASTAWTAWTSCMRGPSGATPPTNLNLFGVYLP